MNAQRMIWMRAMVVIGLAVLGGCGPTQEQQATPSEEQSAVAAFAEGRLHWMKGDLNKAVERYSEAIRLNPEYVEAYVERANCYSFCLYDEGRGLADWNEAIRLDPECVAAYLGATSAR